MRFRFAIESEATLERSWRMVTARASTQYNDLRGSAAATLHANVSSLESVAKSFNILAEEIPITMTVSRYFGINRTDPIEDERFNASISVSVTTVLRNDLKNQSIPEFLRSRAPKDIRVKTYTKHFSKLESIFDWFKEFQTVLIPKGIDSSDIDRLKESQVEEIRLD